MNDLTSGQYETVLQYMQIKNQDSFSQAYEIVRQHHFNLEDAIRGYTRPRDLQHTQIDEKILENYVSYLKERSIPQSRIKILCINFKNKTKILLGTCLKKTIPCLYNRFFNGRFKSIYQQPLQLKLQNSIHEALYKSKRDSLPCLVILSNNTINSCLLQFMQNQILVNKINLNFYSVGIVQGQISSDIFQFFQQQRAPSLIVCRRNIIDRIQIIKRYYDQVGIAGFNRTQIQSILNQFKAIQSKQKVIVRRYRSQFLAVHQSLQPRQVLLPQDQDFNYTHYSDEIGIGEQQMTHSSKTIQQQNQIYKKIEIQAKKNRQKQQLSRIKQQQEKNRIQQLQFQRKIRKMSIPQEPISGDIIRLSFRCPNGDTIIRNFLLNQKMELIFNWVETNDEILFENQQNRQFELYMSYPTISLSSRQEETLNQIFEGTQQKIMIRQL